MANHTIKITAQKKYNQDNNIILYYNKILIIKRYKQKIIDIFGYQLIIIVTY